MIEIEQQPWNDMVRHAESTYPNECVGAMLGRTEDGKKVVTRSVPLVNSFSGEQGERYELRPEDLLGADKAARAQNLDLLGIFHSHPDCDAYFSETDLKNSCPWYSFIVLSIRGGRFDHARSWLPNAEQSRARPDRIRWR